MGSYENIQPGFRDEKKAEDPEDEFWREIRKTKQRWRNTAELLLLCLNHGFGNPFCCITAVKRVANDVENSSGKALLCDETVLLCHRTFNAYAIEKNSSR